MEQMHELHALLADAKSTALELTSKQVLHHQGESCGNVYLIKSGYLKFAHIDTEGAAMITAILNTGALFGSGLESGSRCGHTVTAKGRVLLRRYPADVFQDFLSKKNRLALQVVNMLVVRQQITERRLRAVLTLDVRGCIAVILRDLVTHYGSSCRHGHVVDVPLTQQEFAELIGASRPVVSSQLNQLRREGLISYERGFICVNDMHALNVLANDLISEL